VEIILKLENILSKIVGKIEKELGFIPESVIATGYKELDSMMGGIRPSDLIFIKSGRRFGRDFVQNIIINLIKNKPDISVFIICPELDKEQDAMGLLSAKSQVAISEICNDTSVIKPLDWDKITLANKSLQKSNIQICDKYFFTMEFFTIIKTLKEYSKVDLVIFDKADFMIAEKGRKKYKSYKELVASRLKDRDKHYQKALRTQADYMAFVLESIPCLLNIPTIAIAYDNPYDTMDDMINSLNDYASTVIEIDSPWEPDSVGAVDIHVSKNKHGRTGKVDFW
jgi:replicative DNA helicase